MNSKSKALQFYALLFSAAILFGCSTNSVNPNYDIATQEYEQLTEQYLQHVANFEWEKSYSFLSDNIEFKLPDGDTGTRTVFKGLDQVKDFWNNYVEKSGNNKASFKNFVHVPVKANQMIENVDVTGVFNLCYFSAELSYGSEKANIRMHWAFHFDDEKKIDGIYTYYDRTPIIEASKKNFLKAGTNSKSSDDEMVVQIIKIKSELSEEELVKTAKDRAINFRAMPGLLQKYYIRLKDPGYYGGVYIWDSKKSMLDFKKSELASTIAQAYEIVDKPNVEISDILFQLRD